MTLGVGLVPAHNPGNSVTVKRVREPVSTDYYGSEVESLASRPLNRPSAQTSDPLGKAGGDPTIGAADFWTRDPMSCNCEIRQLAVILL